MEKSEREAPVKAVEQQLEALKLTNQDVTPQDPMPLGVNEARTSPSTLQPLLTLNKESATSITEESGAAAVDSLAARVKKNDESKPVAKAHPSANAKQSTATFKATPNKPAHPAVKSASTVAKPAATRTSSKPVTEAVKKPATASRPASTTAPRPTTLARWPASSQATATLPAKPIPVSAKPISVSAQEAVRKAGPSEAAMRIAAARSAASTRGRDSVSRRPL
jgi:hypothetical protein